MGWMQNVKDDKSSLYMKHPLEIGGKLCTKV